MFQFMTVVKALADENRVRAILALRKHELCVCQIIDFLGLAPSTVSKHMSILRQARLVEGRKVGRWMHYRLATDSDLYEVSGAIEWLQKCLENDPLTLDDEEKLNAIIQCDPKAAAT